MNRLYSAPESEASGKAAALFKSIRQAVGKVPNAYLTIGSNSPDLLEQTLQLNAVLGKSSLTAREREAINLAVSEESGCDYCLAAHTPLAIKAGYSEAQTLELRQGFLVEDARIDALVKFVQLLVSTRGTLTVQHVSAFKDAGFTDAQVVETIGVVTAILFTNMINRVNDTEIDFAPVKDI